MEAPKQVLYEQVHHVANDSRVEDTPLSTQEVGLNDY